jgi:hypothetical protein
MRQGPVLRRGQDGVGHLSCGSATPSSATCPGAPAAIATTSSGAPVSIARSTILAIAARKGAACGAGTCGRARMRQPVWRSDGGGGSPVVYSSRHCRHAPPLLCVRAFSAPRTLLAVRKAEAVEVRVGDHRVLRLAACGRRKCSGSGDTKYRQSRGGGRSESSAARLRFTHPASLPCPRSCGREDQTSVASDGERRDERTSRHAYPLLLQSAPPQPESPSTRRHPWPIVPTTALRPAARFAAAPFTLKPSRVALLTRTRRRDARGSRASTRPSARADSSRSGRTRR